MSGQTPQQLNLASATFQWFLPSAADLLFVVLLLSFTIGGLAQRLLGDAGIGWHIRNGQQMLATHTITRTDSFSATMSGRQWYAWEWLYDAGIAVIHKQAGLNGVVFFTALVIAFTFALVLRVAMARGANVVVTILLLLLSISASMIHCLARPHVLSWLFGVTWFAILDPAARAEDPTAKRRLFWLPLLMLFWANLHGGFLLGFVLLGIYCVDAAIKWWKSEQTRRDLVWAWLRRLAEVFGLSLIASLMNPYGVRLYVHIYGYLTDRFLMNHIDEFRSPDFHGAAQQCFALLLLITMAAMAATREKMRPAHVLLTVFAAWSGLYSSRNLPVSSILLLLIAAPLLSASLAEAGESAQISPLLRRTCFRLHGFFCRMTTMELSFRGHVLPALAVIAGTWVCLHGGMLASRQIMDAHFDAKRFPVQAVDVIGHQDIRDPIFAPDYWGGYLIYRLYPATKVFVDDRHDLYGSEFLKQYLATVHVEPDWDKLLNELHVRWALVPEGSPLANILKEAAPWSVVYEDNTAVLFRRGGD